MSCAGPIAMTPAAAPPAQQPPIDADSSLWAQARALLPAAATGGLTAALVDRHFCVLADALDTPEARLFDAAAAALGARVTHLSADRAVLGAGACGTGPLLARLYDAIECQGLPKERVHDIAQLTSIPVFTSLAGGARQRSGSAGKPGSSADALLLLQACLVTVCR